MNPYILEVKGPVRRLHGRFYLCLSRCSLFLKHITLGRAVEVWFGAAFAFHCLSRLVDPRPSGIARRVADERAIIGTEPLTLFPFILGASLVSSGIPLRNNSIDKGIADSPKMRPSLPRLIRILPRTAVSPATGKPRSMPQIIPPPITPREEAKTHATIVQILQRRQEAGLAKEAAGELPPGAGWPANLRVERRVTKTVLKKVVPEARMPLKKIMKET